MKNFKVRLSVMAAGLVLVGMALGWLGPQYAQAAVKQIQPSHLVLAAFILVGLCGVAFYGILERALKPLVTLTDTFVRMRAGVLDPRLPLEGPDEMRQMARNFNEMMEDLELQIREITEDKHAAERSRQYLTEQLEAVERYKSLVDSSPFGIILADPELNIVYQNPQSESGFAQLTSFLSWNADVVVGRPLPILYPNEDEARDTLSDPDLLPYETTVPMGRTGSAFWPLPYTLRMGTTQGQRWCGRRPRTRSKLRRLMKAPPSGTPNPGTAPTAGRVRRTTAG